MSVVLTDLNNKYTGTSGSDEVYGLMGNDRLSGKAGDDRLYGDEGNDELTGNDGADSLFGGDGNDKLDGGRHADLLLGGMGTDNLMGGDGDDALYGGDSDDTIAGQAGNDLAYGEDGSDTLTGGNGNDTLYGGDGSDKLDGGSQNDILDGSAGIDNLKGGDGNDRLRFDLQDVSGSGTATVLNGGGGTDTLEFVGGQSIDFSMIHDNKIKGIEILDLEDGNTGGTSTVRLNTSDIKALNGGKPIIIDADAGDGVYLNSFTDSGKTQIVNGKTYDLWQSGKLKVLVDQDALVNDTAPVVNDQMFSVDENRPNGTVVGTVSASDIDISRGDALVYSITGGNSGNTFAINSATGEITVADNALLDFESHPSFNLTVQVQDQNGMGLTDTATVTINLGDVPEILEISSLDGSNGFRINGEALLDSSGFSVSFAGDVNGDGFDDVIVGAPFHPDGDQSGAGYVVFGHSGSFALGEIELSALDGTDGFKIHAQASDYNIGYSVSSAGDVNGDGYDDLIVGAPHSFDFYGTSFVVFGHSGDFGMGQIELSDLDGSNGFVVNGEEENANSGVSVSSAGDVNGDGYDDVIVGAIGVNGFTGASYVVFGHSGSFGTGAFNLSDLDGSNGFQINGESTNDLASRSVSSAGDVNGDGFDDLIVGADYATPNGEKSGASYVVFGHSGDFGMGDVELSSLDGSTGFRISGEAADDRSGFSVSSAGDVNGDGYDDLIVGALGAPNGDLAGASYVVFGHSGDFGMGDVELSSLNGSNGFQLSGEAVGDRAGISVSSAGDVNGDGYDDLIVGASLASPNGTYSGASYVVFGHSGDFDMGDVQLSSVSGSTGFKINGATLGNRFGDAVSAAGDVNGDGYDDLIVGAPNAAPNGDFSGASYVIFGGNFTGAVLNEGTTGNDSLPGTAAAESLNGNLGNDTLDGGAGNDVLIGGAGDDVLIFDAADILRVDGGNGTDTLQFSIGQDLDFNPAMGQARDAGSLYTGIEALNLENSSGMNDLILDFQDVLNLSDTTNDLFIRGDIGDTLTVTGGFTLMTADVANPSGMTGTFNLYTKTGTDARLYVDVDISQTVS